MLLRGEEALFQCDKCGYKVKADDPIIIEVLGNEVFHFCTPECYVKWRDETHPESNTAAMFPRHQ